MAVMRVEVQAPDSEGMFLGELKLTTKYEELKIPTQLRTVEGCLGVKPDHVIMKATFPVSFNEFYNSWNSLNIHKSFNLALRFR